MVQVQTQCLQSSLRAPSAGAVTGEDLHFNVNAATAADLTVTFQQQQSLVFLV